MLNSCDKIIAEDISNEVPELILPVSNDTVDVNPVHFKWNEMTGASKYHLMVVSPSFSSISAYVLDTFVTGSNFYYSLDSNEYQLMFAATNGAYTSDTVGPITFWVGVQPSSSNNSVYLNTPLDGTYDNASFPGQFNWNTVTDALSYEISIRNGIDFPSGTIIEGQNGISTTNYTSTYTFTEGEYHWGVKAYLAGGGETPYATRVLYIDQTDPNIASLGSPVNLGSETAGTVTFTWSNGTDPGTINAPVNSLVEVSTDPGFASVNYSQVVQGNSVDISITSGLYYWRVTNYDDAGNYAAASSYNQFTVF